MKKVGIIILALLVLTAFGSCSRQRQSDGSSGAFELALVTDIGTIDDKSFNQGSWEGLVQYAKEKNIPNKYYQPPSQSNDDYLSTIALAVRGGAKVIVTPGFLFEVPVFTAQDRFPDVNFILVDGSPHNEDYSVFKTGNNVVGILYAEDQAGFLAGYAVVKDGYRKLGFMGGMAVPAVVRFGYGFIQGAEYAAHELRLAPGSVTVNYNYTGGFSVSPEAQTMAASWYNNGVEVIFACGGAMGNSVMAAAEQTNKAVIGVDVDQSGESASIITSAIKGLQSSVYNSISDFYAGKFPGGKVLTLAADNDGVGLPMSTSKFKTFSLADYNEIFNKLASGSIPRMETLADGGSPSIVPVSITRVTEVR